MYVERSIERLSNVVLNTLNKTHAIFRQANTIAKYIFLYIHIDI